MTLSMAAQAHHPKVGYAFEALRVRINSRVNRTRRSTTVALVALNSTTPSKIPSESPCSSAACVCISIHQIQRVLFPTHAPEPPSPPSNPSRRSSTEPSLWSALARTHAQKIQFTWHFRSKVAVFVYALLARRVSASFFTATSISSLSSSPSPRLMIVW